MMMVVGAEMSEEERQHNSENGEGDGGAAAGTIKRERTRIFVGGLGGRVTEDDLRKTFSALGELESVDIVRTKGRSFAYLDFLPSSDKSLAKLFSTYNGCLWKGGRLKLEKAKEHYLVRLRREWQENAKHATDASGHNADAYEFVGSLEKLKKLPSLDKAQLRIFFPKLRQVKSVALGGTGKHKYSFQRIEVPPLPIHFCDCEEHSVPSRMTEEKPFPDLERASGGINNGELNMMNSVMNKLFEKENCLNSACREAELANEEDGIGDFLASNNEADDMTDEDNLIINVVAGGKDRTALLGSREQETIMANLEPTFNKSRTFKDRPAQNIHNSQKKKRKSPYSKESDGNEIVSSIPESVNRQIHSNTPDDRTTELEMGIHRSRSNSLWSQKSAWRNLIGQKGNTSFSISDIIPSVLSTKEEEPRTDDLDVPSTDIKSQNLEKHGNAETQPGQSKYLEELAEAPPAKQNELLNKSTNTKGQSSQSKDLEELAEAPPAKQNEMSNKSGRGASWLAKSSWTQLVGNSNNSPFSISQVLPGLTSENREIIQTDSIHAVNSTAGRQTELLKSVRSESKGDCSDDLRLADKDLINASHASTVIPLAKNNCNPVVLSNPAVLSIEQMSSEKQLQPARKKSEASASANTKKHPSEPKQTSLGSFPFSETCPFMRTHASVRERKKAKQL